MILFSYILWELIPQFLTIFCTLSAIIVISQLVRLSEVLVTFGLSLENIFLPFLFILLPFLGIIIPIAFLFAVLLAFSRLSSDGEFTAMLSSGYSLKRAMIPVLFVGTSFYLLASASAVYFEAWGRRETLQFYHRKTQTELDNMLRYQLKPGVFMDNFLGYVLYAEKVSADRTRLENVLLAPGKDKKNQQFKLMAPSASILGRIEDGNLLMTFDYGVIFSSKPTDPEVSVIKFKKVQLDILRIFKDQIFGSEDIEDDFRSYSPQDLYKFIDTPIPAEAGKARDEYLKARYLFHQRFSMPFATIAFGLFAMVFGIQDDRKGRNFGFLIAVPTVVLTYVFIMGFKFLSEKGYIDAPMAAWIPQLVLLSFASFLVYQKNRLPASESILDLRHIPLLNRLYAAKRSQAR